MGSSGSEIGVVAQNGLVDDVLMEKKLTALSAKLKEARGGAWTRIAATLLSAHTLLFDLPGAVRSLGSLNLGGDDFAPDPDKLRRYKADVVGKGRVASQIANAYYRMGRGHAHGTKAAEWARLARDYFDQAVKSSPHDIELVLARAENEIWSARIAIGFAQDRMAIRDLQQNAIDPLYERYGERSSRTGVSHRLGMALSLAGAFYSRRGESELALSSFWEAIHHLSSPGVEDTIRLAQARLSTAEVLIGQRRGSDRLAYVLAETAYEALSELDKRREREATKVPAASVRAHPLTAKACVTLAQARMECGESFEAQAKSPDEWLKKAGELLGVSVKGNDMLFGEQERVAAQAQLLRAWLCERQEQWEKALTAAENVYLRETDAGCAGCERPRRDHISRRLEAEGLLHSGRALTHCEGHLVEGLRRIELAIQIARDDDLIKIEIAGALAKAEAHFEDRTDANPSAGRAMKELEKARKMCLEVDSRYLNRWLGELQVRMLGATLVNFDAHYDDALLHFNRNYMDFHLRRHARLEDRLERTGLSKHRFYELRKETRGNGETTQRDGKAPSQADSQK